jgi:5-formyltetrahydrofolate cyclo-ligase
MSIVPSVEGQRGDPVQHVDELAIESAKALLRRAVILRRDLRSAAQRRSDDAARFEVFRRRFSAGRRPRVVAAYLSWRSEPGTLQLVAWLAAQNISVLLPVMTTPDGSTRTEAAWAPYAGPDALRVGVLSILEPTTALAPGDALVSADLIVCPALAANTSGDRLGRGGGWYDRALHHASPTAQLWALLNDDEVLEAIPTRPWDRRVGAIVTPSRFIDCRPRLPG